MTLYKNRSKFSSLSAVLGRLFSFTAANSYTTMALILSFVCAYFLATRNFALSAVLFALVAFFDVIDGAVARHRKEVSKKGAYFDSVSDRYVEAVIAFGLLFAVLPSFYLPAYFWIALCLFGSMMTTYARAVAAEKSISKDLRGGLLERGDRMILVFMGIVAGYFNATYLTYAIVIIAVLSNISALQRINTALKDRK